ncbi:MAG: glycogen debranching protein GlgX [Burkholderiaceae bacterium]
MTPLRGGRPWPLGAHWDGQGVNIAVFSANAQAMELCVFDADGRAELWRAPLPARTNDVWHGYVADAGPGLVYGLRAQGPFRPDRGHRFNANKVLLDPYAREIVGAFEWRDEHFGADMRYEGHMDTADNAAWALKARVVADDGFDWEGDRHPHTPLADTVLYELHVKGFTRLRDDVPEALRGTCAGLASDAAIAHLRRLGVTAVGLLPVHQRIDEMRLRQMGLGNYWGYNTIGFFCPEPRLCAGGAGRAARDEFRGMVKRLHAAGIEVILDVVYNHTAEGDERGPTLSFRGLDNASYYRLPPDARARYENDSGCGNTLDLRQPRVLQLVLDSLRYWAGEMHVDGFRFDLATVLGRGDRGFDRGGAFFTAIAQDPLLSTLKMIAEPWDLGPGGYQVGGFPRGWLEWNDRFRDTARAFWIEGKHSRGDLALRLCGSSDIFQPGGRMPVESVNYVVSHDGFTLADLVSYERRHNEANGEGNQDGHGENHSANFGAEGPTDDPAIGAVRDRVRRALLATLLLSQGTPMLAAGDEFGHTQRGNNNPYCHDDETTWLDWSRADDALIELTGRLIALRKAAGPFAPTWYDGLPDRLGLLDLAWLRADGAAMQGEDWQQPDRYVLGCLIGKPARARAPVLLLMNASAGDVDFPLPGGAWQIVLETVDRRMGGRWCAGGEKFALPARSVVVLAAAGHGLGL